VITWKYWSTNFTEF